MDPLFTLYVRFFLIFGTWKVYPWKECVGPKLRTWMAQILQNTGRLLANDLDISN